MKRSASPTAFTLVEMLVVLLAATVLLALAIPAILSMRESSRRMTCQHRLAQIGVAMAEYQLANKHYPAGTIDSQSPIRNVAEGFHQNWIVALLADLNQQPLADQIDPTASVYAQANAIPRETPLAIVRCPASASDAMPTASNYAAVYSSQELPIDEHNDGMFFQNRGVSPEEIRDGLEHTLFVGEKIVDPQTDLGWISGTRATLRNVAYPLGDGLSIALEQSRAEYAENPLRVGGLASGHVGGGNLLMGSGRVRFYSVDGDQAVLQQMALRAKGLPAPVDDDAAL